MAIDTSTSETLSRSQISASDCWNVEALYPSLEEWKKDFAKWKGAESTPHWPELAAYKGRFSKGAKELGSFLNRYLEVDRHLTKLYVYAHLRHDEDVAHDAHKQSYMRIVALMNEFQQELSWVQPELLQLPEEELKVLLNSPELKAYRIYLEKIVRFKPHTLSAKEEELLAAAGISLQTASRAFGALNNADLKFPLIADSQGKMHELTQGKYQTLLRSPDRLLRKNAYEALHQTYQAHENTLCELINGQVQSHLFQAKTRNFASCLEAALFPHQIDKSVYMNLLETIERNLPVLHHYLALRKKLLKVEELCMYDLHVSLVESVDLSMSYAEAEHLVIDSVHVLGEAYQEDLRKGLLKERWVDRYENARKRSGAYSSGCYDTMPYILLNYHGNFQDMMTLAHEAGHSMHSLLSRRHQTYQDADYPIFVAEVASTFNEELVSRHLLGKLKEKEKRAYLLNQKIEDIRNTFFRQAMFARFELRIHELAEQGTPLTPTLLKQEYRKLNEAFFGPEVTIGAETDIEWARIPHFYYNFYVYQYATGISAALALVEVVAKEGPENYLKFLSSGGSRYPLDLLKAAGVDMRQPHAIEAALERFRQLTEELADLLDA